MNKAISVTIGMLTGIMAICEAITKAIIVTITLYLMYIINPSIQTHVFWIIGIGGVYWIGNSFFRGMVRGTENERNM